MLNNICNLLTCNTQETEPILKFINEISVGDIISFLSMLFVIIGGCFGYHQWKKSVKIKRAEYLNELTEKIRTDDDISEMIYILDYDQLWYKGSFHQSDEFERKMDKTLSYFSYICYLFDNNLIGMQRRWTPTIISFSTRCAGSSPSGISSSPESPKDW